MEHKRNMSNKLFLRHRATPILGVLVLALGLICSGCLFQPREPNPPSTGASVQYLPKSQPRNVWENLQTSLQNNDSFGWDDNISDDFTYVPDSEAEQGAPGGFFTDWNKEREINFIDNFYNAGVTNIAQMRNDDFAIPEPSGTQVVWEGVIYYLTSTNDLSGSEIRYSGSAIITFLLEGTEWYIYRWEDQQGESDPDNEQQILPSLGVLRATFGSN
jgi:hypothetical protein